MINKEFLEGLGITDEAAVKSITDTYNADIKAEKDGAAAIQTQLDEANTTIKSYADMDIEGVQKSAADWEEKYKKSEADRLAFEEKGLSLYELKQEAQKKSDLADILAGIEEKTKKATGEKKRTGNKKVSQNKETIFRFE